MDKRARRIVSGAIATVLATVGVQIVGTSSAFAHTNVVSGSAACQQDGTYSVTWTIENQYDLSEDATLDSSGGGALSTASLHLDNNATAHVTQSGVAGSATSSSLTAHGTWTDGVTGDADGQVTLDGQCATAPGHEVKPVVPSVHQAVCYAGQPTAPTIALPTTSGITYSTSPSGPFEAGQSVTVTATAKSGDTFTPPAASGWTYVDATHETYGVTFDNITCGGTATPVAPTLEQAQCQSGTATAPTLTLASTSGITYTATPTAPYSAGQSVRVTATADGGNSFDQPAPSGWTFVDSTHETYQVVFDSIDCGTVVTPVVPLLKQAQCAGGAPTIPTLTLANTSGITYTVNSVAPYAQGETVTVTATAIGGHSFERPAPSAWTYVSAKSETDTVVFAGLDCNTKVTPAAPKFTSDQCVSGAPTGATYTIVATAGVNYVVNGVRTPAGTYPVADSSTVMIVAMPKSGYTLTGITSFTHTFTATPDCSTKVTPAAPRFTDDQCVNNQPAGATYTIVATPGVDYFVNDVRTPAGTYPASAKSTVTITTKPRTGYSLTGTQTFTHTFPAAVNCAKTVKTVAPGFSNAECSNGAPTQSTYTLTDVTGIDYAVNGTDTPAGTYPASNGSTVTVIATAARGYTLTGTTEFKHVYAATPTCAESVVAAPASFTNDVCVNGLLTGASYTIPPTTGVKYSIEGSELDAGTYPATDGTMVTIRATAKPGFTLTGITQWTHSFPARPTNCNGTENISGNRPPSTIGTNSGTTPISADRLPSSASGTASTGVPVEQILLTGLALLLLGTACFVAAVSRRRGLPTA